MSVHCLLCLAMTKRKRKIVVLPCFSSLDREMPLYGRRLFHPPSTQSQGSFVIQHTGQTFDQADIYQKLLQIYALERWTCECTWRASLTHAEAFQSEIETRRTLKNLVAEHFYKPIFDVIHHSSFFILFYFFFFSMKIFFRC